MSGIDKVKSILGFKVKWRGVIQAGDRYHLREEPAHYMVRFEAEKCDIGPENTYLWDIATE